MSRIEELVKVVGKTRRNKRNVKERGRAAMKRVASFGDVIAHIVTGKQQ